MSKDKGTVVFSQDKSHVLLMYDEYIELKRRAQEYDRLKSMFELVRPVQDESSSLGGNMQHGGEGEGGPHPPTGPCTTQRPSAALEDRLPKLKYAAERKKVQIACLQCHHARKACDEGRPCKRCVDKDYNCTPREPVPRRNGATKSKGKEVEMAVDVYPQNSGELGYDGTMPYVNGAETASRYMNAESSATGAANWTGPQYIIDDVHGGMYQQFGGEQGYEGFNY